MRLFVADYAGHAHIDADYHHQPAEVNFWIPLTEVFGTNTLFVESAPGEGDYHPIELKWGSLFVVVSKTRKRCNRFAATCPELN